MVVQHWWRSMPEAGPTPVDALEWERRMNSAVAHLLAAGEDIAVAAEHERAVMARARELWTSHDITPAELAVYLPLPVECRAAMAAGV